MKMLSVESFRLLCNSSSPLPTIPQNLISFPPLISKKTHKINSFSLSLHSNASSKNLLLQVRTGFSVSASKKRRKSNGNLLETGRFDDDEDEDEEEDEEEGFIPFESMRQWVQNKPSGFGDGKEFDTSIEDKLLEEMEQSRRAQLANINKLKNNPLSSSSKERLQVQKAADVVPSGIRVRVGNLPKKKNIHRDLQFAFKGFPGIVNIIPAVSGNKKTRDPICKGFVFVDLQSKEVANRFIQMYSRQSITFGKIQKQITCEITNPSPSSNMSEPSVEVSYISTTPELSHHPSIVEDPDADLDMEDLSLDSSHVVTPCEEGIEHFNLSDGSDDMNMIPTLVDKIASLSLKQQQKRPTVKQKQKLVVKGKFAKAHKLSISGSAKRLKIKEKAVLTEVFSKYGTKASVSINEG